MPLFFNEIGRHSAVLVLRSYPPSSEWYCPCVRQVKTTRFYPQTRTNFSRSLAQPRDTYS
uniref:Uncharacterized protein n=1 Tax=Oryza brachyantha TaxID=4533 RepID=J3L6B0_ORYBR